MNQIDLSGKSAVITGGAEGIGLAIAKRFLASGASVSLWDQNSELLNETYQQLQSEGPVHTISLDVSNSEAVAKATKETLTAIGKIDILINNAGIAGPTVPSWEYKLEDWHSVIKVDLNAVFYCCREIVPHMREQNYGRIINVASIAAKEGNPNSVAYSAAKAGVVALTKTIAKETANKNIGINCITPAAARTRIFAQINQKHIDYMLSKIPRGRFVEVEEIASMVAWLASTDNSYTTGAVFDLSGGRATY